MVSSRTALVLYGSETGNAQDVAEEVGKLLQRLRFKVRVTEMNTVQLVSSSTFHACNQPSDLQPSSMNYHNPKSYSSPFPQQARVTFPVMPVRSGKDSYPDV